MVVMVVPVVMVKVVVMMVPHRPRRLVVDRSRSGGGAGRCFLRSCVSGEAERNNGYVNRRRRQRAHEGR